MIAAERIVRLVRNLTAAGFDDPTTARGWVGDYSVEIAADLDLEDRATLLRLCSGEVDEITAGEHGADRIPRHVLELLRDVLVDGAHECDSPLVCSCSTGRARRLLLDHGIEVPE